MPSTIRQLLSEDVARLVAALQLDSASARLEAQYLLQHALGKPRAWLLAHADEAPDPDQYATYAALLQRRLAGEPVAYILGEREFYGRSFRVTPATLIPRPETEHLVEAALARGPHGARVLDIGTGSGCIAITLKLERPDWQVAGVDLSADALAVARGNGERLGAKVEWLHGDLFAELDGRSFDLVVANPPYVAAADPHLDAGDVRFEPRTALVSGEDGLDAVRAIVTRAPAHLAPGGWLLLEHGWDQGEAVGRLLAEAGFGEVFIARDLAGRARIGGGRRISRRGPGW